MEMKFYIQGGYLEISKSLFVKEMLSASSVLKKLLNYEIEDQGKKRVIEVNKEDAVNLVKINFTAGSNVYVGEDYRNLLSEVKKKYKGSLKGEITLMAVCFTTFFIKLNLNSDDETIVEVSVN